MVRPYDPSAAFVAHQLTFVSPAGGFELLGGKVERHCYRPPTPAQPEPQPHQSLISGDPHRPFHPRFVRGDTPNPQGQTLSIRRTMHISRGSNSRDVELVLTRSMVGPAGISPAAMRDPALWWTVLEGVERHLNATFATLDEIPDRLCDLSEHRHLGKTWRSDDD